VRLPVTGVITNWGFLLTVQAGLFTVAERENYERYSRGLAA
jgi:hypothetical protein